jgi:membrane protease YdiL (CAAX protease family)
MFLLLGDKGRNDFPYFLFTIAIVIIAFAVLGYLPISFALNHLSEQNIQINEVSELQGYIGLNNFFLLLLIPFITGFITLMVCVKWIHKQKIITLFTSRSKFDWKRFSFSFFLWGSIMVLFLIASILFGYPIYFHFNSATFFPLFLISFLILPLQTTFEELFFRGYLFQSLGLLFRRGWLSVVITGVLFGLMHGSNPEVEKIGVILLLFYVLNGVFLGVVVLMDDGLELSMGYHAVNNIFAALVVTNDWQAFHTDALFIDKSPPEVGIENILTLLVIQPLFLFLFSKKYNWSNWKSRLFTNFKI